MKTLTIISTIAVSALLSGCSMNISVADAAYQNMAYKKAARYYEKALSPNSGATLHEKIAKTYEKMNNMAKAEEHYGMAASFSNAKPSVKLNYAKALLANGKQTEYRKYLNEYLALAPEDNNTSRWAAKLTENGEYAINSTKTLNVELVPIIGYTSAYSPLAFENTVYFISERKADENLKNNPWNGHSFMDVCQMKKAADSEWYPPTKMEGNLNGSLHEGPMTLSANGNTMFVTKSAEDDKNRRKLDINRINQLKIAEYTKIESGEWGFVADFPFNESEASTMHPTLTADGQTIFFVSDKEGGFGGNDIYMSKLNNGQWTMPVNLGAEINSEGNEAFPFAMHSDTLYFASNGHGGLGGLDIFIAVFDGKNWSAPQPFKAPINTHSDDFGLCFEKSKERGYFSSNRDGKDQIYYWSLSVPETARDEHKQLLAGINPIFETAAVGDMSQDEYELKGTVVNRSSGAAIEGIPVELLNSQNEKIQETVSDEKGNFSFKLKKTTSYKLYGNKKNSFAHQVEIPALNPNNDVLPSGIILEMEAIATHTTIELKNIYYNYNRWDIRHDAVGDLENLLRFLKDNPDVKIEIRSHTDSRGTSKYNLHLSNQRAKATTDYLVQMGINTSRLTYKGYGETVLLNKCADDVECSEEQHQENRRTEFKVLSLD